MEDATRELVGRERESAALAKALDRLESSRSLGVLLLSGEPGIGKTRLLADLCTDAAERGHLVLEGRASEYEQELPFGPLRDALDDYLAAQPERSLAPLGSSARGHLARIFPSLSPGESLSDAVTAEERFRLHESLRRLLEQLASQHPVVLALDDLHWSDAASLELIAHLVRRPAGGPVLLALVTRAGIVAEPLELAIAPGQREGRTLRIDVGPLSEEAVALMLAEVAGPERIERVMIESGGNPFYADELVRAGSATGTIPAPVAGVAGIPPTVTAALAAELAQLDEPMREIARAAAVAGESLDSELLAAAAGVTPEVATEAVDALCELDLLRPTEVPRRFRFRHPIVRTAIHESAPPSARAAVHERLAAELAARGAPSPERAIHVESSAEPGDEEAIELLLDAARSVAGSAPDTAARWLGSALRLLPPVDERRPGLLAEQAGAFAAEGRYEQSREALGAVLATLPAEAVETRIGVAASCARLDHLLGRHVEAHDLLRAMLAELPEDPSRERLSLKLELGSDCFFRGDFDGMREWMREVLDEAGPVGDTGIEAAAKGLLGCAEYMAGDPPAARLLLAEFFGSLAQMSDRHLAGHINTVAWCILCEVFVEQIDPAIAHSERALEAARSTGKGQITSLIRISGALALLWRGRISEGKALAEQAIDATILSNNRQFECWARWVSSWGLLLGGDVERATAEAREAVAAATGINDPVSAVAGCHLGEALLESGDADGCRAAVLSAVGGAELPLVERPYRARWYELLARAELEAGRLDAAEEWTAMAERSAEGQSLPGRSSEALRARARICLARGDVEAAAEIARKAVGAAGESNLVIWEGWSRTLLGRALVAAGDQEGGAEELERARLVLADAGAVRYADAAARELRTLGRKVSRRGVRGTPGSGVGALSGRESEVATLAAAGNTNREIAASMFISEKTVEKHMARVFEKLEVGSRAEVAHRLGAETTPD